MKRIFFFFLVISFVTVAQPPAYTAVINNPPAGYYFVSAYKTAASSYPIIFDDLGHIVYYEKLTGSTSIDFKLHADGRMSYFRSGNSKFLLKDSTFTTVDSVSAIGYNTDLHELQVLSNGHYLLLASENNTEDLSMYYYFTPNHASPGSTMADVKSNVIQELDANKNLVFEWHLKDNFPFNEVDSFFLYSQTSVDWSHSNALEFDRDSNILLSSRHFDEITKIDRDSGKILWHFGGKYNQFTFLTDTTRFYGQHDIRRLPNGHITLYDDGNHFSGSRHAARALEYELDEVNMTAKLVWSYTYNPLIYSTSQGSVQMLPGKIALIDYGTISQDSVCFNMVDSLGTELYNIRFNKGLVSYRTHYYPSLPWQLHRPTISCFDSLGVFYLKTDSLYNNHLWNDGSTGSALAITDTGTYYVFVPYGEGFISSNPLTLTSLNAQCISTTGTGEIHEQDCRLFPNPAQNRVTVFYTRSEKNAAPVIKDVYGKSIELQGTMNPDNSYTFDTSMLSTGIYFVHTKYGTFKFIKS